MKRLLRSVIDVDGQFSQENLVLNFQKLLGAQVEWGRPDDTRVYNYVHQFFTQHLEVPSMVTLFDHFEGLKDVEVIERLKDFKAIQGYIRTNYTHLLKTILEEQNKIKAVALLKEAHEIIARGLEIDGEKKHGVRDGLIHFAQKANDLIVPDFNARIRGDIRLDGQAMIDEYEMAETNKDKVWGKLTGINDIDKNCRGAKKGELWVHAAYPGELKTTFAANWCYNLVTRYKTNVVYISLEMPYEQVRRQIYTVHTSNMLWHLQGIKALDYRKIRDGELSPEERKFYEEKVVADFANSPHYTKFEVVTPDKEWNMHDVRMELELLHKQFEVGFVVIDHGQWVEARKGKKNSNYVIELNSVVRDAKRLALHFNHREGIPVLLLWQINRDGKDDADKNDGIYKAKALTYANEVEKTADVITTTYLNDDHRKNGTTKFTNIKNRDNPLFNPFLARIDFGCRRIRNIEVGEKQNATMSAEENESILDSMDISQI